MVAWIISQVRFHTTMVLTQPSPIQVFDVDEWGVSIPLWFSRNIRKPIYNKRTEVFPYHYGSHATLRTTSRGCGSHTFPYHYGSHATDEIDEKYRKRYAFPYHYGSHATELGFVSTGHLLPVSIPLWFSRNLVLPPLSALQ